MRFHFKCELEKEKIAIDYRRKIVSFLKFCVQSSNKDFYAELYGKDNNTNKDFAMAVYFIPETQVEKDYIYVKSKRLIINLSTPDTYTGVQLYNALCKQKFSWFRFSDNALKVIEIHTEKEKMITQNKALFTTLSPIVIRDHDRVSGKDWFYTYEDEHAAEILKRNLQHELEGKFPRDVSCDINQMKIEFIKGKKVIVKCYELKIPATLGVISLDGEQYLLQYLYQRGIGSKRSLAFGMLELL